MTPIAIEATTLTKTFRSTAAVTDLSLSVPAGTVLALLGPNGSGKTTTVRMLATLLKPTSGTARIAGLDVRTQSREIRRSMGLTGQFTAIDPNLTGRENLLFVARLLGMTRAQARRRAEDLLHRFALAEASDRPARTYSGGMSRRLDLASSLLGDPRVLFLDEPTTGLDPIARDQLWDIIQTHVASGCTVLLTTQYLEEADRLADTIVIIDRGRKVAEGAPRKLKELAGNPTLTIRAQDRAEVDRLHDVLLMVAGSESLGADGREVSVHLASEHVPAAIRAVDDAGIGIESISLREPDLDDVFRTLTSRGSIR